MKDTTNETSPASAGGVRCYRVDGWELDRKVCRAKREAQDAAYLKMAAEEKRIDAERRALKMPVVEWDYCPRCGEVFGDPAKDKWRHVCGQVDIYGERL
jgi:Zn-finger nucleic acid-binding protein